MATSRARKSPYPVPTVTRGRPRKRPAEQPSTPVSEIVPDAGPKVLQLFDERPHPALPSGTLARYPLSDLSEEAISLLVERVTAAVLAELPAALARARMQP